MMKGVVGLHIQRDLEKQRASITCPNFEHQGLARSWPPSIVRSSATRCDELDGIPTLMTQRTHRIRRGVFQWRLAAAKNAAGTTFIFGGLESAQNGLSSEAF